MRNSALGRGLGELMEPPPPNRTTAPAAAPAPETAPRPAGVHIFLQPNGTDRPAENGHAAATTANDAAPRPPAARSLLVTLLLADALLCGLAWFAVTRGEGAVGWLGWLLVTLAIGVGAWLSVLACGTLGEGRNAAPRKNGHLNGGG